MKFEAKCSVCPFYSYYAGKCIGKIYNKCIFDVYPQWKNENFKKLEKENYC